MRSPSFLRVVPVIFLGALAALAGCAEVSSDEGEVSGGDALTSSAPAPEVDDEISRIPWQGLGTGVSYKPLGSDLQNVLIIYGGFTAELAWVERWCDEMIRAKNPSFGVGHLYAVKGPNTPLYANREIANSKLAAHLGADGRAANADFVAVIAHSSGTYVADELFAAIDKGTGGVPPETVGKLEYFNLDGGGPADASLLKRYAHAYFVYGHDGKTSLDSHNASGMKALGEEYAAHGGLVKVDATGSGCGATWCMHDALINAKPHNPQTFDLARDYTDFSGSHRLVTSYLDSLSAR